MRHKCHYCCVSALAFILFACPPVLSLDAGRAGPSPKGRVHNLRLKRNGSARAGLSLKGRVHNVRLKRNDSAVRVTLDLSLDFVNTGNQPIIILRPEIKDVPGVFWVGGVSLAWTRDDSEAGRFIYAHQHWPSFYGKAEELAGRLDQANPPVELTRVIHPNEMWTWRTQVGFYLTGRPEHTGFSTNLGWDEIGQASRPVWLRLDVGMLPFGLEAVREGILLKLQRRWQNVGRLWVGGEGMHQLTSEPIALRLK